MLTRMIIALRVPMAMMAALLVAVMVASIWLVATGMVLVASEDQREYHELDFCVCRHPRAAIHVSRAS